MKKEFSECPEVITGELYGFDWKYYVTAIPVPLMVVTTYKENGKNNATLQSWSAFTSAEGFFCVFASVNKNGHMYKTIQQRRQLVINFPSVDIYKKCQETIKHNGMEDDEISVAGLTAEKASLVDAPRIRECFLNLECEYVWEKEIVPGSDHVVMCVRVLNMCMDSEHYDEAAKGRYGESGYLYNIHAPRNPETGKVEKTYVGVIQRYATEEEL